MNVKDTQDSGTSSLGINFENISSVNKSSIIKYLRRNGVCSRAQISKAMGLTQASISKITGQLIAENIVFETGYITGEKGRRSVGLALNTRCKKVLGVRISRRSFAVGLFDLGGNIYESISGQFDANVTLHDVIRRIKIQLHDFLDRYKDIAAIGVAVPGPVDLRKAEILLTTSMATSDWTNVHLREEFGHDFPVEIVFCHDAIAGGLANWWFGSHVTHIQSSLVHFLVGDGVGAGYIVDGEMQQNRLSCSAEVGHVSIDVNGKRCRCGNRGCLEMYCSTFAFMEDVTERLRQPGAASSSLARLSNPTPQDVFFAAEAGDRLAQDAVDRLSRYMGYGVVNIINTYVPDLIVISNEMAKGGQRVLKGIKEVVRERVLPAVAENVDIQLEDDWLLNDPVLYGAGAVAINYCLESPISLLGSKPG